jgi:predicted CoA-binding protein
MTDEHYSDSQLHRLLERTTSVAVVGVSPNPVRPSNYVARYLMLKGYRVIPVNPVHAGKELFGLPIRESLSAIEPEADPVEMVDIFRRSEQAGAVVDEAMEALGGRGLATIWMQIGVADAEAAARARAAGLEVVMNRCPKIEYQRLFGELRLGGFNTGRISSRRP